MAVDPRCNFPSFHSHPGRDTHGRSNPFARGTPLHIKKSYPKRARLCIGGASDNGAAGTYTTRQPSSPSASTTAAAAIPVLSTASVQEYAAAQEPATAEESAGSRLQRVLERRPARVSPCPYARCANFPASTTILMACASETCLSCLRFLPLRLFLQGSTPPFLGRMPSCTVADTCLSRAAAGCTVADTCISRSGQALGPSWRKDVAARTQGSRQRWRLRISNMVGDPSRGQLPTCNLSPHPPPGGLTLPSTALPYTPCPML